MTAETVTRCHIKACAFVTTHPDRLPWLCPTHAREYDDVPPPPPDDPDDDDDDGSATC